MVLTATFGRQSYPCAFRQHVDSVSYKPLDRDQVCVAKEANRDRWVAPCRGEGLQWAKGVYLDELPVDGRALYEHLCARYLAEGDLGNALKVFGHLPRLPEHVPRFVCPRTQTSLFKRYFLLFSSFFLQHNEENLEIQ